MKKCFFIFLLFISPSSFLQAQKKLRFEPIEYTSETILKCQGEFKKKQDSLRNLDPPKYLIEFPSMFPEPDFQGKTTLDKYLSTFLKGKKRAFSKGSTVTIDFSVSEKGYIIIKEIRGVNDVRFKKKLVNKLMIIDWLPGECSGKKSTFECELTLKIKSEK